MSNPLTTVAATNAAPAAAPAPATQLTTAAHTDSAAAMRAVVRPSVEGTISATTPTPQTSHAATVTVARTALDRPSIASPIDQMPAAATTNQEMRGPHKPATAESRPDGEDDMSPHLPIDQRFGQRLPVAGRSRTLARLAVRRLVVERCRPGSNRGESS